MIDFVTSKKNYAKVSMYIVVLGLVLMMKFSSPSRVARENLWYN